MNNIYLISLNKSKYNKYILTCIYKPLIIKK